MKKIAIIGGGISGLVAAFLLKTVGFEVTLFEKSERAGGNIQTAEINGFKIEYAPNSLLKSPRLVDLIKTLGLENEVLAANVLNKKRYVLQRGKLKSLPMSIAKMAISDYFSWKAKFRLLKEPFIKSKSKENESVAEFFERRLGREIVEKAADPFIAGIYAGNPGNLSVRTAFPRLHQLEENYGSLLAGSLRSKAEKVAVHFPRTFSFKQGVQTLTDRLSERLGDSIRPNIEVRRIQKTLDEKWLIETDADQSVFDAVVISTPAEAAEKLIREIDADLGRQLKNIYYPPIAMVFFGIKRENITQPLDGFGFLVPSTENRKILGTIWNSAVFENRAPDGYHLLTTFVGGARNAELFEKTDEELFEVVFKELQDILGLRDTPDFMHLKRWPKAIPQYLLGYEKVESAIANFERNNKGVYFCSNFYQGISVGDCVKNAYQTAEEIEIYLKERVL